MKLVCLSFLLIYWTGTSKSKSFNEEQAELLKEDKTFWYNQGRQDLVAAIQRATNVNKAKNIIFFLGDGMGVSTVTAARIYAGQKEGKLGEEYLLNFEKFPNVGLLKTYNVDKQVADSAGTATAYLTGVKGRYATIGLDVTASYNVCEPELGTKPYVDSILKWAQESGKDTGIVTTTRVTHATPAGLYAHTPNRDWECDSQIPAKEKAKEFCKDIAKQLIEDVPGKNIKIILGGGRQVFEPAMDNGTSQSPCRRGDNLDLITAWKEDKQKSNKTYLFLQNRGDLAKADLKNTDYILGLFAASHIPYELDRKDDLMSPPGIAEMTEKAIQFLKKSRNGFFLLVEGGRIDHAHHLNLAKKALEETVAMDKAVAIATKLTRELDTLIVVTADHSHSLTINGYPVRGNPITGIADKADTDYNYTTLLYSTGPGFWSNLHNDTKNISRPWIDASNMDLHSKEYKQLSPVAQSESSHGGEDVPVYAMGAMSHLFHGVHEQSYVAHAIAFAGCFGPYTDQCDVPGRSYGTVNRPYWFTLAILTLFTKYYSQ